MLCGGRTLGKDVKEDAKNVPPQPVAFFTRLLARSDLGFAAQRRNGMREGGSHVKGLNRCCAMIVA